MAVRGRQPTVAPGGVPAQGEVPARFWPMAQASIVPTVGLQGSRTVPGGARNPLQLYVWLQVFPRRVLLVLPVSVPGALHGSVAKVAATPDCQNSLNGCGEVS